MTAIAHILSGPQGSGKSLVAPKLAVRLGCTRVIDEWTPEQPLSPRALHLTNESVPGDDGQRLVIRAKYSKRRYAARLTMLPHTLDSIRPAIPNAADLKVFAVEPADGGAP